MFVPEDFFISLNDRIGLRGDTGNLKEVIYLMQRASCSINEVNMNNRKRTLTVLVVT